MKVLFLTFILLLACSLFSVPTAVAQSNTRAQHIRMQVKQILDSPDFSKSVGSVDSLSSIGRKIKDFLSGLWEAFKKLLSMGGRTGVAAGGVMFYAVFTLLLVLIAWIISKIALTVSRRANWKTDTMPAVGTALLEETIEDPVALAELAARMLSQGEIKRAYRAAFLAILRRLDAFGKIHFERDKTNGDYLRTIHNEPVLHRWLMGIARQFDVRWYGTRQITEDDVRRTLEQFNHIPDLPSQ